MSRGKPRDAREHVRLKVVAQVVVDVLAHAAQGARRESADRFEPNRHCSRRRGVPRIRGTTTDQPLNNVEKLLFWTVEWKMVVDLAGSFGGVRGRFVSRRDPYELGAGQRAGLSRLAGFPAQPLQQDGIAEDQLRIVVIALGIAFELWNLRQPYVALRHAS
jgi:hypothetical protein